MATKEKLSHVFQYQSCVSAGKERAARNDFLRRDSGHVFQYQSCVSGKERAARNDFLRDKNRR